MTESQKRFLTEYLGECDHEESPLRTYKCSKCGKWNYEFRRLNFDAQDKQDLLKVIDRDGEFIEFHRFAYENCDVKNKSIQFFRWFVFLSPEETAELICRWKVKY